MPQGQRRRGAARNFAASLLKATTSQLVAQRWPRLRSACGSGVIFEADADGAVSIYDGLLYLDVPCLVTVFEWRLGG